MEAATKVLDQSSHNRPRLSSISSMKSIGNVSSSSEPDLNGLEGDEKEGALSVPPLPLYALLAADKDTSGSGSATAGIVRSFCITHPVVAILLLLVLKRRSFINFLCNFLLIYYQLLFKPST